MFGWHHWWVNAHEFEQAPGVDDGQGSLACCSPWDRKSWTCLSHWTELKGNQSWIFTGRADAEAEVPILWPPDVKTRLIGKDPDPGKDWGQKEKGVTKDEVVEWHHLLNVHESEQTLGDGEVQESLVLLQFMGLQRVGHDLQQSWFLYMVSIIGRLFFFCKWISKCSNPFFRKILFLHWITFATCPDLFDYICVGPFLDSLFHSSYLSTNTTHIDDYSYMVSLKIKEWKSFNFAFLF